MKVNFIYLFGIICFAVFCNCEKPKATEPIANEIKWNSEKYSWFRTYQEYGLPDTGAIEGLFHVAKLSGPKGATLDNLIPGTYKAEGIYDLSTLATITSGLDSVVICLRFVGAGQIVTGKNGLSAAHKNYVIDRSNLKGSFTAISGFLEIASGNFWGIEIQLLFFKGCIIFPNDTFPHYDIIGSAEFTN